MEVLSKAALAVSSASKGFWNIHKVNIFAVIGRQAENRWCHHGFNMKTSFLFKCVAALTIFLLILSILIFHTWEVPRLAILYYLMGVILVIGVLFSKMWAIKPFPVYALAMIFHILYVLNLTHPDWRIAPELVWALVTIWVAMLFLALWHIYCAREKIKVNLKKS